MADIVSENAELPASGSENQKYNIKKLYLQFLTQDPDLTMPIAAIESLIQILKTYNPNTSAEMINIINGSIKELTENIPNSISLRAGCDIFYRFVIKHLTSSDNSNKSISSTSFESFKSHLFDNGQLFIDRSKLSRFKIAEYGSQFIKDGDIILVHGYSRSVIQLLLHAKLKNAKKRFKVLISEGRPTNGGILTLKKLRDNDIYSNLISDSAINSILHKVNKVFVGAEGVTESGGCINLIGTSSIGILAKEKNIPFYVAAESHKFVRMFPLMPNDLPMDQDPLRFVTSEVDSKVELLMDDSSLLDSRKDIMDNSLKEHLLLMGDKYMTTPILDFTKYEYITAIITDLGIKTPSAISEELMNMWYD